MLAKFVFVMILFVQATEAWKYQTRCTRHPGSPNVQMTDSANKYSSSSIVDDFEKEDELEMNTYDSLSSKQVSSSESGSETQTDKYLHLKCPNMNDFLFIGLTQYGVSNSTTGSTSCRVNPNDCLISVDYIANQCNGLNACDIQLDSQFLHSCKNHSDYINIAYECISGSKRMDVCSNDETFIIDSSWSPAHARKSVFDSTDATSRFGSFYLSTPNYPIEYGNNLNNCSCRLEYVQIDNPGSSSTNTESTDQMNLMFKTYEFDLEEADDSTISGVDGSSEEADDDWRRDQCNKDRLKIESIMDDESQTSSPSSISLCGQFKEFKEFYAKGNRFNFKFSTDDAITRRGFLLKIEPIAETQCPHGSKRFDSNRCIKYFGDENNRHHGHKLGWQEAHKSCQAMNGRLLVVNDFVDNLKLNSHLKSRIGDKIHKSMERSAKLALKKQGGKQQRSNQQQQQQQTQSAEVQFEQFNIGYWVNTNKDDKKFLNVVYNNKNGTSSDKCLSKRYSYWSEENCATARRAYICEFDAINLRPQIQRPLYSLNNGNRLIRVKCGSGSNTGSTVNTQQSSTTTKPVSTTSIPTTTTTTTASTTTKQKASSTSRVLPILVEKPQNVILEDESTVPILIDSFTKSSIKSYDPITTSASASIPRSIFNIDIILILAIVCGISIVIIAINVFCIWNYYNKKLKGYFQKSPEEDPEENYHRTSTMIRQASIKKAMSSRSSNSSATTNRTLSSTADSYAKVPTYEVCLSLTNNKSHAIGASLMQQQNQASGEMSSSASLLTSSSSANSSPNSTAKLSDNNTNNTHMTTFLPTQPNIYHNQLQHFYETICAKEYNKQQQIINNIQPNYAEYQPINLIDLINQNNSLNSHQQNSHQAKFDSYVMLPGGQILPSVVLINPTPQHTLLSSCMNSSSQVKSSDEQQYSSVLYGEQPAQFSPSSLDSKDNQPTGL